MEFDVTQYREGHEENQSGIEEDQSSLDNMSIVCQSAQGLRLYTNLDEPKRIKQAEKTEIAIGYPDSRIVA